MKRRLFLCVFVIFYLLCCSHAYAENWICPACGQLSDSNFCSSCGTSKPSLWTCTNCGAQVSGNYCKNCGHAREIAVDQLLGNWKFSFSGYDAFLRFMPSNICTLTLSGFSFHTGTYDINGTDIHLAFHDYALLDIMYVTDERIKSEVLGIGKKTDEFGMFSVKIDGHSMENTIKDGQTIRIQCCDIKDIECFDIVIVSYPELEDHYSIARIIGMPGDKICIDKGYLYVNGIKYTEDYISDAYRVSGGSNGWSFCSLDEPFVVPEGTYFAMGDHRNNCADSRSRGPIPEYMIYGKVSE